MSLYWRLFPGFTGDRLPCSTGPKIRIKNEGQICLKELCHIPLYFVLMLASDPLQCTVMAYCGITILTFYSENFPQFPPFCQAVHYNGECSNVAIILIFIFFILADQSIGNWQVSVLYLCLFPCYYHPEPAR